MITVSIVEDNEQFRETLLRIFKNSETIRCVSAYETAERALEKIPKEDPDVVLMDINLPKMNGVECVRKLKEIVPDILIVMLTMYDNNEDVFDSLKSGASGYLLKRSTHREILEAIEEVYKGGSPMSVQIARKVVQSFQQTPVVKNETTTLTKHEENILLLLTKGFHAKEIGEQLSIANNTVRTHIQNIYKKLHVRSRAEAVVKYLQK